MKKKLLFILAALLLINTLNAADFKEQLATAIAPNATKYLLKTKGFRPSSKMAEEPSLWNEFVSLFTSEKKEARQQAIADYIYNMYVIDAARNKGSRISTLDTTFVGALDPIYRSTLRNANEVKDFYYDNIDEIRLRIANNFKTEFGLSYNGADKDNSARQGIYINMLANTYNFNRQFSYMPGKQGGIDLAELSEARMAQLKKQLALSNNKNKDLAVIYEHIDPMEMLDNASRIGPKSSGKKYTYRPLREECAACSYSFCKDICIAAENKYSDFRLLRIYDIKAYPRAGLLKDKNGNDRFISPKGETYPQWDYHAATLLVFEEADSLKFIIVDTLLLAEPATSGDWINLFDQSDTFFRIAPFIRNDETEKKIVNIKDLPDSYQPHAVRK